MAITLEQLRQKYTRSADEMDLFCKAAGYLLAGLNTYRESCLVSGLPFCGKMEQSYQTLSTRLKSLATEALDFDYNGAALTEALKATDQLGPFLNVKVGPGNVGEARPAGAAQAGRGRAGKLGRAVSQSHRALREAEYQGGRARL